MSHVYADVTETAQITSPKVAEILWNYKVGHVLFNKAGFIAMFACIQPAIAGPLLSFLIL